MPAHRLAAWDNGFRFRATTRPGVSIPIQTQARSIAALTRLFKNWLFRTQTAQTHKAEEGCPTSLLRTQPVSRQGYGGTWLRTGRVMGTEPVSCQVVLIGGREPASCWARRRFCAGFRLRTGCVLGTAPVLCQVVLIGGREPAACWARRRFCARGRHFMAENRQHAQHGAGFVPVSG